MFIANLLMFLKDFFSDPKNPGSTHDYDNRLRV